MDPSWGIPFAGPSSRASSSISHPQPAAGTKLHRQPTHPAWGHHSLRRVARHHHSKTRLAAEQSRQLQSGR
eukprot:1161606-Pelagomonas_calceolata.AAC.18